MKKMSEAIDDMVAYTQLTDNIYQRILFSVEEKLEVAKGILQQIERRDLYKCVAQSQAPSTRFSKEDEANAAKEIVSAIDSESQQSQALCSLAPGDILVDFVKFDYGMNEENPMDSVRFYVKNDPNKAVKVRKDQVSQMLPERFAEVHIRVYCRKGDKNSCDSAFA
jgi:HD superfamily phosphohydrolase